MLFLLSLFILLFLSEPVQAQKFENLAQTPPMGWNSWNCFHHEIDEQKIKGIIDIIADNGLREAGYIYVNIDDTWQGERDADGFIQPDPQRFPHGIKWLSDYAHSKGLKLGIYSDAGYQTCGSRLGSLGHEYQDALQYARWGIDFLKYDWCNTPDINPIGAYRLISDALRAAGRPVLLAMCEWGNSRPWRWAQDVGHTWRTTGDIGRFFDEEDMPEEKTHLLNMMKIISINDTLRAYAGPGHWNDPDMLQVGNGLTEGEDRAHFTIWCMMAAPLLLGNDLRNMSEQTRAIIMNREMIAVNQDPAGIQGWHFKDVAGMQFWLKPLQNGDWAFVIFNPTKEDITYKLNWQELNVYDEVAKKSTDIDERTYRVRNLWTHRDEGRTSLKDRPVKKILVPSHDCVAYRLCR